VDQAGNLWCGLGSDGSAAAQPQALDGVRVYDPDGRALAHIHLPERCANLCFGGPTATGSSWPPATRCTRCTSTRVVLPERAAGMRSRAPRQR
jgi:sugar lactone lactonase YvrE